MVGLVGLCGRWRVPKSVHIVGWQGLVWRSTSTHRYFLKMGIPYYVSLKRDILYTFKYLETVKKLSIESGDNLIV